MSNQPNEEQRRIEDAQKLEFARLLFEAGPQADPFNIGFEMFPGNTNRAVLVGGHWRADPLVISELARLRAEQSNAATSLPGHSELARQLWQKMQSCEDPDAYVKLAKLYAEINGLIKKPDAPNPGQNVPVFHVMQVTDFGDEVSWEQKLLENQNQLQEDGLREVAGMRVD